MTVTSFIEHKLQNNFFCINISFKLSTFQPSPLPLCSQCTVEHVDESVQIKKEKLNKSIHHNIYHKLVNILSWFSRRYAATIFGLLRPLKSHLTAILCNFKDHSTTLAYDKSDRNRDLKPWLLVTCKRLV